MSTKIFKGNSTLNPIVATVSGARIYKGNGTWGSIIGLFDEGDGRVYEGNGKWGHSIIATVKDSKVYEGNRGTWGRQIAFRDGNRIYEGNSSWNPILATIEGSDSQAALAAVAVLRVSGEL